MSHLKQASFQNIQNIQSTLSIQQTYPSTLSSHITSIYSKLTELQQQIQQHCMYPHNTDVHQTDTVQIEAPDYDPDIDRDKELNTDNKWATVSVQDILDKSHNLPELLDDNSTTPGTATPYQDHIQTDWPDAPAIQVPEVSSATEDSPPELTYT